MQLCKPDPVSDPVSLAKQNEKFIYNKSGDVRNNYADQCLFMPKEKALKKDSIKMNPVNGSTANGIDERSVKSTSYKSVKK